MNFTNIVKKQTDVKPIKNQDESSIELVETVEIVGSLETIESKWSSYYTFNIIDLFSDIKYDFNILFGKCDINNFVDFVIVNSSVYDPHEKEDEIESEDENDNEYYSD